MVRVLGNDHVAFLGEVGEERKVALEVRSDPAGIVKLRLAEPEEALHRPAGDLRVGQVSVRQLGPRVVPAVRLLQYALLAILLSLVPLGFASGARIRNVLAAVFPLMFAGAIVASRLRTLGALPWVLVVLAVALVMVALSSRGFGMDSGAARGVALAAALKVALVVQAGFPRGDAQFHVHRALEFSQGRLITSRAPGPDGAMAVPYPPAIHALLAPWLFEINGGRAQLLAVSLVITLLEALTPLLVFGAMRAGGASAGAAAVAALAQAAMPEGLLIPAKGLAANALASFVALGLVWAILRRASPGVLAALFALALLSHNGTSLTLGALVLAWTIYAAWRGELSRREALSLLGVFFGAAALAWLVYWRQTALLLDRGLASTARAASADSGAFFAVRWVRVGKVLQDLVLKFGAFPILVVLVGARRLSVPSALRSLLLCWFGAGGLFAAAALLTPFPLRFEYFLMPAVAMAMGFSAAALGPSRAGLVRLALALTFALQAALGLVLALGRFDLMSVIMESPKWPFPVR